MKKRIFAAMLAFSVLGSINVFAEQVKQPLLISANQEIGEQDMAEMTITVKIEDLPEFKARLARIKKIMRRRAWVNGHRTGKARKSTWKRA